MEEPPPTPSPASAAGPPEFARPEAGADLTPLLKRLLAGETLAPGDTTEAFQAMMTGKVHEAEIGAFLALLARRGPTPEELLGAARVMRAHVDAVTCSLDPAEIVDTAGTGGAPKTFNVSTAAALLAAGAGAKVAKHGNRSRTGRGSAEVLRALGVNVDADRAAQARCLEEAGICFCFAIHHHPATRHVIGARRALGFATIFNLLGPLTNPAGARRQIMGVYDGAFVRPVAETLARLGSIRAIVLHGDDGLDEFTVAAPTRLAHVQDGAVREERVDPESLGLTRAKHEDLQARDVDDAARIIRELLDGTLDGPKRDMAILNAAATLLVAGRCETLAAGLDLARNAIASGAAAATLNRLIRVSQGPT